MALKTLNYTVSEEGITPIYVRNAGMQYDHQKTQLNFTLTSKFYNEIIALKGGGDLIYRYDCYDGEGTLHLGETKEINDIMLEPYMLEYWVTKFGGKLKINLVITVVKNGTTNVEFSHETVVALEDLPEAEIDESSYKSLSTLARQTIENSNQVKNIKKDITELHKDIKNLSSMLQDGEWVFGGEIGEDVDVDFVVEDELDGNSNNPVANGVITQKFNEIDLQINELIENIKENVYNSITDEMLLAAHPVGCYYWSNKPTNPAVLFGGTWESVKDVFVLAAGRSYGCGATGGERSHVLTAMEMPKHRHKFDPNMKESACDFVAPTVSFGTLNSSIDKSGDAHSPGTWASYVWGTTYAGGSQAHNNMPPYIAAYCWRRTA